MNSVAAPRLRITVTVSPKARGLALGLTITAATQLIARLTQVTLKNAVDYSSYIIAVSTVFFRSCAKALKRLRRSASSADHRAEAAVLIKCHVALISGLR